MTPGFGRDLPLYLQQALVDQDGDLNARVYTYFSVTVETQSDGGHQHIDLGHFGQAPQQNCSVTYGATYDDLNGDLAGIGAQFDS